VRAGKLDREITIQRYTESLDDYGVPQTEWALLKTLRAEIADATTDDVLRNFGTATEAAITFRTRYVSGITTADCVGYAGQHYAITELKEIGRRRGLEIRAVAKGPLDRETGNLLIMENAP
jgi:SPP1 family predicted phage head-tail adaptor